MECRFTRPDAVLLPMLRVGEWLGTLDWVAERSRRFFCTVARTDVELLRVPGGEMQALLRSRPEAGRRRDGDLSPDKNSSVARGNGAPRRR